LHEVLYLKRREIMKRRIFHLITSALFLIFFLVHIAHSQTVVERYRLGNAVESITFISSGSLSGKFALADGTNIFSFNAQTGEYEKLFSQKDLPLHWQTRGICHISQGDYAGNLILNDSPDHLPNMLYIVSYAGDLIAEVTAVDFNWETHCEGITQITSGPYQGNFAMICYPEATGWESHIIVFEIKNNAGSATAHFVKDICGPGLAGGPLSVAFIPDDYPDPQYRNHFACTDINPDPGEDPPDFFLRVIDEYGNLVDKYPLNYFHEGLAYISKGPNAGCFMMSTISGEEAWIRNLEGSEKIPIDFSSGFGIMEPISLAWLEASDEFVVGNTRDSALLLNIIPTFHFLSRLSQENWTRNDVKHYRDFYGAMDITELTAEESYYMLGYYYESGIPIIEVHNLWPDFTLKAVFPLADRFYVISYIPGATTEYDRFAMVHSSNRKRVYLYGNDLANYETVDLDGKVERITDIYYDAAGQKYYILDSMTLIRVFDPDWAEIDQCDISSMHPDGFRDLVKITSGDLKDHFAVINYTDFELIIFDYENQKAVTQLENLIDEILASTLQKGMLIQTGSIEDGLKTSLITKIKNAISSIEKGKINTAIHKIKSFQNEVQAQRGKKIPKDLADRWINKAEEIVQDLRNSI